MRIAAATRPRRLAQRSCSPPAARSPRTHSTAEATAVRPRARLLRQPRPRGDLMGIEQGFFDKAGLDVTPRVPSDPSAPIKEVAAGRADLAISYEPEVLLAREQGLDVVAVAAMVDEPLTSLISLPEAGIADPGDLRGKTVATAGIPYQSDYLATILAEAGLDSAATSSRSTSGSTCCRRSSAGRRTRSSAASATSRASTWPSAARARRGPPVDQLGVPTYDELVLVANGSDGRGRRREELRLFIGALAKGTADAVADPAAAAHGRPGGRRGARPRADEGRDRRDPARCSPSSPGRALRRDERRGVGRCSRAGWPRTA